MLKNVFFKKIEENKLPEDIAEKAVEVENVVENKPSEDIIENTTEDVVVSEPINLEVKDHTEDVKETVEEEPTFIDNGIEKALEEDGSLEPVIENAVEESVEDIPVIDEVKEEFIEEPEIKTVIDEYFEAHKSDPIIEEPIVEEAVTELEDNIELVNSDNNCKEFEVKPELAEEIHNIVEQNSKKTVIDILDAIKRFF